MKWYVSFQLVFQSKLPQADISFQWTRLFESVKINIMIKYRPNSFSLKNIGFHDEKALLSDDN